MVVLLVGLMLTAGSASSTKLTVICEVGSIAMRDSINVGGNKGAGTYYAASDPNGRDLLTICPKLKAKIPRGWQLSDDDARSRAAVNAPIPGRYVRPASIYSVGIPEFSSDAKSAVVHFFYSCTGLCGGELEARYVRTSKGWQRDGAISLLFVS